MFLKGRRIYWAFVVSAFLIFGVACGDEDLEGGDHSQDTEKEQDHSSDDPAQDDEGCADDKTYNPITGECVDPQGPDDPSVQDTGSACDGVECDDGLHCDPNTAQCVECIDDGHCHEGYYCQNNECVSDEQPTECSNDDHCSDNEQCNVAIGLCEEDGETLCGPGTIVGETCTADDGVLPGANVVVEGYDCDGVSFRRETTADNDGAYEFENIPSGTHQLTISSGSFEVADDVSVQAGEVTDRKSVGHKLCFLGTEVDIAVATGTYDDIVEILTNMNIEFDVISDNYTFFSDLDQMQQYDIIFVECGTNTLGLGTAGFDTDSDEIAYNIRRYVETGRSLYASDHAQPFVQFTLPDAFHFYNGETLSGPRIGNAGNAQAEVLSDEMFLVLESHTVDINFNMDVWAVVESVGPATDPQFRADAETSAGVLEDLILMGIYDDPIGNGRAIFTSFHNNAQATDDMEDILEFMIFQL